MIATVKKDKLPAFLAYPTGAQAVSDALADVPQLSELKIWFSRNDYGESEVQDKHLVFTARYQRSQMGLSASHLADELGWYGPLWDAWVYAVPKALKFEVRAALADHGFALVRQWYLAPRPDLWLTSSHSYTLWFDPGMRQLSGVSSDG